MMRLYHGREAREAGSSEAGGVNSGLIFQKQLEQMICIVAAKFKCPYLCKVEMSVGVVRWECGNRGSLAISKDCGKGGRPDSFIVPVFHAFHQAVISTALAAAISIL
jgi:hypothetical protein